MTTDVTSPTPSEGEQFGRFPSFLPDKETRAKLRKRRRFQDRLAQLGITLAGFGVVFSLLLIFVYLFYEVMPILYPAKITPQTSFVAPGVREGATTSRLFIERFESLGLNYTSDAKLTFFELDNGTIRQIFDFPLPKGVTPTTFANAEEISGLVAYGLDNGQIVVAKHDYTLSFPNDQRYIEPRLEFPYGRDPITLDPQGREITHLALQASARGQPTLIAAAYTVDKQLIMAVITSRVNLMTGATTTQVAHHSLPHFPDAQPVKLLLDKTHRSLFVGDDRGFIHYYDIATPQQARLVQSADVGNGSPITAMDFLVGSVSIIAGTESGELSQWFLVRDENNENLLTLIRRFQGHTGAITQIVPEYTRKGFLVGDVTGAVGIHYATSENTLLIKPIYAESPVTGLAVSPLNRRIVTLDDRHQLSVAELWNRHPQISFSALWGKVWYEGRGAPDYVWQSSSGSDEFESKFSLVPLSIGSLKAAFFAMMFAVPLGLMGAVYTAYFMTPKLRGQVKPTIEIMEALPTVILGFLAGLWLAPFIENNLPATFIVLFGVFPLILLTAIGWKSLPKAFTRRVPPGWEAVILIPVIVLFLWIAVTISPWLEIMFFNGSMRQWFTDVGVTYDQRNALVVGIAMGFAIIPTIYSIAEDAVFNVPKHLTQGSLALGATPWQTVMGVVLPTASPGMFSAVMIGFGRAIGETMIVLMATGNSPVVNFNLFEGMRTLSANIAVELPETAVGSTHFRILFLAALVLFLLTFIFNTIAEVVRQRLRRRYSSL